MSTQYIKYNILRVLKRNLESTIKFYTEICGMSYNVQSVSKDSYPYKWEDTNLHIFSFGDPKGATTDGAYVPTGICFIVDSFPSVDCVDRGYWKMGFCLRDVNAAIEHLRDWDWLASSAEQFIDIGFLVHIFDPNEHCIELLQHDFKKNFVAPVGERKVMRQPVDVPPTVGQITIRCKDEAKTIEFYTKVLGMKLVCIEPIKYGSFVCTLYFFAYTDEDPPNAELTAVENREWLYHKTFCQIEIQRHPKGLYGSKYRTNDKNEDGVKLGHVGFCLHVTKLQLETIKSHVKDCSDVIIDEDGTEKVFVSDPDGYLIELHA